MTLGHFEAVNQDQTMIHWNYILISIPLYRYLQNIKVQINIFIHHQSHVYQYFAHISVNFGPIFLGLGALEWGFEGAHIHRYKVWSFNKFEFWCLHIMHATMLQTGRHQLIRHILQV